MVGTASQSVFDIPVDDDAEARADACADTEIEDGKGVPHEQVREWLIKLGKGDKAPIPKA
jgi:predicted transcriptional regulator